MSTLLDEEVQEEEEEAEEEEERPPGKAATGELGYGMDEAGGNDTETRFATAFVKWTGGNVAREIAAERGDFVIDPEGELRAMTP
ncbi:MAG: hypothetical protein WBL50_01040 [Candidatus Acidiferrum sp.]